MENGQTFIRMDGHELSSVIMTKPPVEEWLEKAISDKKINFFEYEHFTDCTEIGSGSFGKVDKYELKGLNCLNFDKKIEDFENEINLLKSDCEDQNIIKFYGVTKDNNGLYYMVLQYADEGTLHEYLTTKFERLRWTDKLKIANGIACGLSFLHNKNIIHKDLHSKNILIHQGKPKIDGFLTSKQINKSSMDSNSYFIGLLEYTDPQCIMYGEDERNKKSDVYSFGIILWEISSGIPPYQNIRSTELENSKLKTYLSFNICTKKKREEPIEGTPTLYIKLYKECWDNDHTKRPETYEILKTLTQIIEDEKQIEEGIKKLKDTNLDQIDKLENQYLEDLNGFKEISELYIKPRGTWNVPIIKTWDNKKEMVYEEREGDIEKVIDGFLTSKDKLTSHDDNEKLKDAVTELINTGKKTSLIETVNSFFEPESQLTLEDINVVNAAADQFLALKDKNALKLLKIAINQFLDSNDSELENSILNVFEKPLALENELFKEIKLALNDQITLEDMKALKNALREKRVPEKEELEKTANKFLALKTKEFLENEVNKLLTLKRKRVLLILGSEGMFSHYFAHRLRENANEGTIPLFIALAPLERVINQNQDFIEFYLRQNLNLSDKIDELRNRKFVFILNGYDEISKRECHFYNSNMFYKWKNVKIIVSSRSEYLDKGYEKKFWPKENGKRGFQELTLASFSWVEIEQKYGSSLPCIQQINRIPQINELVCNPILLKITLTVLPDLLRKRNESQNASKICRIVLYDEFIKKWFKRAQDRSQEFNRFDKERFINFCKKLALEMFLDDNKVVVDYNTVIEIASDKELKHLLLRFGIPLIRRGNQCWFFHKSLRDYLISCALLDSIKDKSPETPLNKSLITSEPAIQQFLAEQIENMPEQKKSMTDFIKSSKNSEDILIASANAITVLSRLPRTIRQIDLNDISVPRADLRNRDFSELELKRANLDYVNFQDAKLQGAKLEGTSLQNAKLQYSNLEKAILQDANLSGSNLSGANLQNSDIQGANFHEAYLKDVNFKGAILRLQDFQELDFPHTGSEKPP